MRASGIFHAVSKSKKLDPAMATKFPALVSLKLPTDTVETARQQAKADDRSLSQYLRRIVIDGVEKARTVSGSPHEGVSR